MSREEPPLGPKAVGIAIGIWITVMLLLALVVVPTLFGLCTPAARAAAPP